MSLDQIVQDLIHSFQNGKVVLFCGAGISASSGLPMAGGFMESIFNELGVSELERKLIYNATLPFESFISILQENSRIDNLLEIFNQGEPTLQHKFIAELMVAGKVRIVVTTNFDGLIEKALEYKELKEGKDFHVYYQEKDFNAIDWEMDKPTIIKIHGSVHDPDSMAITMQLVAGKRYSEPRSQIINHVFSSGNHEYVLITGYSCSDFFDISPYIEMIQEKQKKVVLVDHKPLDSSVENIDWQLEKNPFKKFHNSYRIKYHTETLVKELWSAISKMPEINGGVKGNISWQENIHGWHSTFVSKASEQLIIGRILMDIDEYKEASQHFRMATDAARTDGDRKRESFSLSLLGNITDSVEDLNQALSIAIEINDRNLQANCFCSLIPAYLGTRQVNKAIECGNAGLEIAEAIGDKSREARLHGNLGGVYGGIGKLDIAIAHLTKGYLISQEIGDKAEEGRALLNIAAAYDNRIWDSRAEENYKKSREVFLPYLGEDHRVIREIDNRLARLARKPRIINFSDL